MKTAAPNTNDVLAYLMFNKKLKATDLAKLTGISQPTLQRLISGKISNPRQGTLKAIAEFFKISVDQLKGNETIPWLNIDQPNGSNSTQIPVLEWSDINTFLTSNIHATHHIYSDASISDNSFATTMNDSSMEPLFPMDTLLIFNPKKEYRDRSYVLIKKLKNQFPLFRQLITDGNDHYIKPLSPDLAQYKMMKLENGDKILGALVQSRFDY